MVAVGGVELSEHGVFGPAGEVLGDVLLVAFVGREYSVKMFGDVLEVEGRGRGKGVGVRRRSGGITPREVFIQEGGGGGKTGFFNNGKETGGGCGRGNILFVGVVIGGGALCRSGVSFGHLRDFVRVPRCFLR